MLVNSIRNVIMSSFTKLLGIVLVSLSTLVYGGHSPDFFVNLPPVCKDSAALMLENDLNTENSFFVQCTWLYDSGQKRLEGSYINDERTGKWVEWYENGQIRMEIYYQDGQAYGKWIGWHENGQLAREGYYEYSFPSGRFTAWHENGQIRAKGNYYGVDGIRDDYPLTVNDFQEDGGHNIWFLDGRYYMWLLDGSRPYWYLGLVNHGISNGTFIGKWTYWHKNSQIALETNFNYGYRDGKFASWYASDQKKLVGEYKNSKRVGEWFGWCGNGEKIAEGNYINGKKDGKWIYWHKNGWISVEENYKDGKKGIDNQDIDYSPCFPPYKHLNLPL